jgi:tRNA A37 threonylcarbamoyladenosine dehydratase
VSTAMAVPLLVGMRYYSDGYPSGKRGFAINVDTKPDNDHSTDRYHRQVLLPQIGPAGQTRLAASHALIVGCGALGCVIAEQLARAGVGSMRLVDRDVVEPTNLQRQVLFDESHAREGLPKAVAAQRRLAEINSATTCRRSTTSRGFTAPASEPKAGSCRYGQA